MAGRNVSYVKQKTPSFIQKFKDQVGYKEGPDVNTKLGSQEPDSLDDNEQEDEKPTVVLENNVSEAEATKFLDRLEKERREKEEAEEKDSSAEAGKIMFKKPTKRKSDEVIHNKGSKKRDSKRPKAHSNMKEVNNRTLLSFDDDEEA